MLLTGSSFGFLFIVGKNQAEAEKALHCTLNELLAAKEKAEGGADSGATPKHKARPAGADRARITDNADASKGRNYARAGMNRRLATQTTPSTPKLIAAHSEGSGTADRPLICMSK